jgi:hypothetical protein
MYEVKDMKAPPNIKNTFPNEFNDLCQKIIRLETLEDERKQTEQGLAGGR